MTATTPTPHDAIFKAVFSDTDCLCALLRAVLPSRVSMAADWSRSELLAGETVDATLVDARTDLELRVPVSGSPVGFIALTEHRSTGRLSVPLQVPEYQCRRWDRLEREGVRAKRPPIAAIVISHGEPWRIPTSFEDTIDLRGPLADLLPFVPRMRYLVVDASRLSDQDIAGMRLPPAAHVLMHLFRDGRSRVVPGTLVRVTDSLTALLDAARETVVVQLLRYAARLTQPEDERAFRTALRRIRSTREDTMRNMDEVLYDEALEKGIERGIERGIDKGIELGREQARREMFVWLLTERFGALAPHVVERIAAASSERVDAWRARVLTASSVADVLDA